ncbi:helix-turn-helix transcriptional regulator [Nocardia sp. NPDC019395]|uniref:helix-turn-helix transcriptional regulator n=1 Tax=Nocardia sp. NPDC019395 TaxID=3154686 RepID=UPI00340DC3A6
MSHEFTEEPDWQADLTTQRSGTYTLLRWDQRGGRRCNRGARHIVTNPGDDFYWVVLPDHGSFGLRFRDDVSRTTAGTAAVAGMELPCLVDVPTSACYALQVPRTEFDHRVRPRAHMNVILDMTRGLGRIAGAMIRGTHAEESRLSDREFNAVCDRITELLCMMVAGETEPQRAHRAEVAESIRRYLRTNIGRGDVRLPAVANALGWSERQVRVVLQESGTTFRDVRREEALRAAREMLEDPRTTMSIADLATRCGFTPAWFSAAFKERFGQTPREFRQHRRGEIALQRA